MNNQLEIGFIMKITKIGTKICILILVWVLFLILSIVIVFLIFFFCLQLNIQVINLFGVFGRVYMSTDYKCQINGKYGEFCFGFPLSTAVLHCIHFIRLCRWIRFRTQSQRELIYNFFNIFSDISIFGWNHLSGKKFTFYFNV